MPPFPRVLQGNSAGTLGCGTWNTTCGSLNMPLAWEIVYCVIFFLVVVAFPFFIFFYEADDEGTGLNMRPPKKSSTNEFGQAVEPKAPGALSKFCNCDNCAAALCSAITYTCIVMVIVAVGLVISYYYLATAYIPYKVTSVSVASTAFFPVGTPISGKCALGTCLMACGTGACNWSSSTLSMQVRRRRRRGVATAAELGRSEELFRPL